MSVNELSLESILFSKRNLLTDKEKKVANFILENRLELSNLKINNIKKECDVGTSTVYSLLNKIDIKSVDQLNELIIKNNTYNTIKESIHYNSLLQNKYVNIIESNSKLFTDEILDEFINDMNGANSIYTIGWGESNIASTIFSRRLSRMGLNVIKISAEREEILSKISIMQKNDLLISFSISGKTESILEVNRKAKEKNIKTISISNNQYTDLKMITDKNIYVDSEIYEKLEDKMVYSIIPFVYLVDCIISKFKTKK